MRFPHTIILCAILTVAGVGAFLLFSGGEDTHSPVDVRVPDWRKDVEAVPGLSAEAKAEEHYRALGDASERMKLIDWIAGQPWARPNRGVLAKAMATDADESVRLHALAKSLELGERTGQAEAKREILRAAFGSDNPAVAQAAMLHTHEHPDSALVPDLLKYADDLSDPRTLSCWTALALIDDPIAKAKILDLARDTSLPHAHRVRAVTLLAKHPNPAARPLLESLAASDDHDLQLAAQAVLEEFARKGA